MQSSKRVLIPVQFVKREKLYECEQKLIPLEQQMSQRNDMQLKFKEDGNEYENTESGDSNNDGDNNNQDDNLIESIHNSSFIKMFHNTEILKVKIELVNHSCLLVVFFQID